jgi:hypothetical protein
MSRKRRAPALHNVKVFSQGERPMSKPSFMHTLAGAPSHARYAPHALATTVALALVLSGCGSRQDEAATAAKPEVAAVAKPAAASICQASQSWITNPNPPAEVPAAETFCDFYQFSWQWFLAQVSPATDPATGANRVFETNRLHNPNIKSGQCSLPALMGRAQAALMLDIRDDKPLGFEDSQADGNALYDQNGNILVYNTWYSKAMCDSTQEGFAWGTFEIKVAWKVLPQPDPTYYSMQATLPGTKQQVTLGMVGFHIANWTQNHPEMIWATFEHKTNAPLCDGSSAMPASGWSFTSADAANCLAQNPQKTSGPPSSSCSSFAFNTPNQQQDPQPLTGTPNNVCRQYAWGNQQGASVNGNDNQANVLAIVQLNEQLVGPKGMLTVLPDTDPMAIWKNYEMIGGIWTKGGASSGNAPVPHMSNGSVVPGDPNSPQRGSLELANMSMETFQQGDTSYIPNCFGCHNFDTAKPLNVSHICTSLFASDDSGKNCIIPPKTLPATAATPAAPAAPEKK